MTDSLFWTRLPLLLLLAACIPGKAPPEPPPLPTSAMRAALTISGTVTAEDGVAELPYTITCPAVERLPGAAAAALLEQQRQGLQFPGGEGEEPFYEVLLLPGPFGVLDEATLRRDLGAHAEPWHKYESVGPPEANTWTSMAKLNEELPASDASKPAGALICTLHSQLDQLTEAVFVDEASAGPKAKGEGTGTYRAWFVGVAVDGALVAVRTAYVRT